MKRLLSISRHYLLKIENTAIWEEVIFCAMSKEFSRGQPAPKEIGELQMLELINW